MATAKFWTAIRLALSVLVLALSSQFYLSWELWFPKFRSYPKAALFPTFPLDFSFAVTNVLSAALLLSLILAIVEERWQLRALKTANLLCALLVLDDVNRLQAWFHLYWSLLLLLWWVTWRAQKQNLTAAERWQLVQPCWQFMFACLYCWTGLQKFNVQFVTDVYPWLAGIFSWTKPLADYTNLGYGIGIFELLIGLCLFSSNWQRLGVYLGTSLHLGILALLIADNWNTVVYPWNLAMITLLWGLFYNNKKEQIPPLTFIQHLKQVPAFFILLFGVLPGFALMGYVPHCLGLGMYSGTSMECDLILNDKGLATCVPEKFHPHLLYHTETSSTFALDDWCLYDLNVPPVATKGIFERAARHFCTCSVDYQGAVEFYRPLRWVNRDSIERVWCETLLQ